MVDHAVDGILRSDVRGLLMRSVESVVDLEGLFADRVEVQPCDVDGVSWDVGVGQRVHGELEVGAGVLELVAEVRNNLWECRDRASELGEDGVDIDGGQARAVDSEACETARRASSAARAQLAMPSRPQV